MVLTGFLIAQANQPKPPGRASARPPFALERKRDEDIDLLSLQVVEDGLQRLYFSGIRFPRHVRNSSIISKFALSLTREPNQPPFWSMRSNNQKS
jgi:hypothetical protein